MSNKRLKIENLENLQELTTEEFSSIEGGLSLVADPGHALPIEWEPEPLPHPYPTPIDCYPKPVPKPLPCHIKPIEDPIYIDSKYPVKEDDIIIHISWCPVVL